MWTPQSLIGRRLVAVSRCAGDASPMQPCQAHVTLSYCALNSHPHYRSRSATQYSIIVSRCRNLLTQYPGRLLVQYHKGFPFCQLKQQYRRAPPSPQPSKRSTPYLPCHCVTGFAAQRTGESACIPAPTMRTVTASTLRLKARPPLDSWHLSCPCYRLRRQTNCSHPSDPPC
jgi:hypothetical protein